MSAELPEMINPTIEKIYQSYVNNNGDWRRGHLGASIIGQECERKIWYTFRWCTKPSFDGRMLRLFDSGHRQESRLLNDLKRIGCTVYDVDPETGKQIHYSDFGGHFSGSLDAVANGFEESKAWHVIECKTSNSKNFGPIKTKGVRIAKFEHYAQMQSYMLWSGLDRAYYFCVCKDTDELYGERVQFDKDLADRLSLKAHRIIFSDNPLQKIGDKTNFKCKWCEHKDSCHGNKLPEINCRTCAYADVVDDGKWNCTRSNHIIEPLEQRNGCPSHIFIPSLVPLEQTDADAERGVVMYGDIVNGPGAIPSTKLQEYIK